MPKLPTVFRVALTVLILSSIIAGARLSTLFPVWAQEGGVADGETGSTNPKPRTDTVTATVPDNLPPSAPILISPPNNSFVTTTTPTFVWEASTDDRGMEDYQLYLDGVLLFDNIPLGDTTTSEYTLDYNSTTDEYSLTVLNPINDGVHTWKIRAIDVMGLGTDSATWTFTLDTLAPSFVLTQVGDVSVSISAQDASTVPTEPLELSDNEPQLVATGEANSTVAVTLTIPGENTQFFTTTIDSNGNWDLQLGVLPRDVVMTLDFIITDQAGHVSVLTGVQFIINQDVIIFPPPSPSPSITPGELEPSPSPGTTIVIPITPVRETVINTAREIVEQLPSPFLQTISSLPPEIQQQIQNAMPVSAVIVSSLIPIATIVSVASQFGWQFSFDLLFKILQALGILPKGKPQGLVFDSETSKGVPFALLTVKNTDQRDVAIYETVVTDVYGIYKGVNLPNGEYQITVSHQEYRFPTHKERPVHLQIGDFYRGEVFVIDDKHQPLFLIPVDPLDGTHRSNWKTRLRLWLAQINRQTIHLAFPLFLISGLLAIVFPSIWNTVVFILYCLIVGVRVTDWFKVPVVSGVVIDDLGQTQMNVAVRLIEVETNQLTSVLMTDEKGVFRFFGKPGLYQLALNKQGYVWAPDGSPLSLFEVDAREKPYHLVATLTRLEQLYQDLFVS